MTANLIRMNGSFRADQIGSYLRPETLKMQESILQRVK